MLRETRAGIPSLVLAWMLIGSSSWAQMPMTRGKGGQVEGIDEKIIRDRNAELFAVPRAPAPAPVPQARFFLGAQKGSRAITLEPTLAAHGEDLDDPDGPPGEGPARPQQMPINLHNAVLKRENFDRWVFSHGVFEVDHRDYLDGLIRQNIETFSRTHPLTDAQRSKLRLAGQGDIKRFLERVEARRREFETARMNVDLGIEFLSTLDPLRREFEEGPFGIDSLFAKTRRKIQSDALAGHRPGND